MIVPPNYILYLGCNAKSVFNVVFVKNIVTNFWLQNQKQSDMKDMGIMPYSCMFAKWFQSKWNYSIKSLEGSPVPLAVLPSVALYLGGVYPEAWGTCWEAVVPLEAFPLEGNEAVFPVVPSRGCNTDGEGKQEQTIRIKHWLWIWHHPQEAVQSVTTKRLKSWMW